MCFFSENSTRKKSSRKERCPFAGRQGGKSGIDVVAKRYEDVEVARAKKKKENLFIFSFGRNVTFL